MSLHARLSTALGSRYTIEHELGRGGMAIVFQALDHKHDRRIAVKVFRPELSAALGTDRFLQEIQITARLQHPHIVPLHDSGAADGLLYYIMPLVEGESLRARLDREKQLPLDEALATARDVADALSHAHSHGVVHRDVKPENILLSGGHALVADFGVAGAISAARRGRLTQPGLAVGTPAYMSPEQAAGRDDLDGRSDVYSLGCVLYEMLAGQAPFTGKTPDALAARHLAEDPPSLHAVRTSVPTELERVIGRALAKTPADRFRTAAEFQEALARPVRGGRAEGVAGRGRRRVAAGVVAAVALTAVLVVAPGVLSDTELDVSTYAVMPFGHREGAAPDLINGSQCELYLSEALRAFVDLSVVEYLRLRDALARRGGAPGAGFAAARELGAGRLVQGEVAVVGDSVRVLATVYDVRRRRIVRQAGIMLGADLGGVRSRFARLAAELLELDALADSAGGVGTRVAAAARAFVDGRDSVAAARFAGAALRFGDAVALDPDYAAAHLWLAQVQVWRGRPTADWQRSALRAAERPEVLGGPVEAELAVALAALAEERFPQACEAYRTVLARDSGDVAAWIGVGECESRDTFVVRHPASPSGWAFRGSHDAAISAYRRALTLVAALTPAFYDRLARLVPAGPAQLRRGVALPPDTGLFLAPAALGADTLAYIPRRAAAVGVRHATPDGEALAAAAARGRAILRDVARDWAQAYPLSVDARLRLARTLELFVDLPDALEAARAARQVAPDSTAALEAALTEVRLQVKLGAWDRARAMADSLLDAWRGAPPERLAEPLAVVAALTGRAGRAADLLAGGAGLVRAHAHGARSRALGAPVFEARERARAYAALGGPRDSLLTWIARFEERLAAEVGPQEIAEVRVDLLLPVAAWGYPTAGVMAPHRADAPSYLLRLQAADARGDHPGVREGLRVLEADRAETPAGQMDLAAVLPEALLQLAIGDTAAAVRQLEGALGAIPAHRAELYEDVPFPAALIRAMMLRAELALVAGDTTVARRWAAPVATLWGDADPPFQPRVARMRALAR